MKNYNSSAHATFSIYYHFVFIPKYRQRILIDEIKINLEELIEWFCKKEKVEIAALAVQSDHVHLLISASPDFNAMKFIGRLKQRTCHYLFRNFPDLLYEESERGHLWSRGYFVTTDTVNEKIIEDYIKAQSISDKTFSL